MLREEQPTFWRSNRTTSARTGSRAPGADRRVAEGRALRARRRPAARAHAPRGKGGPAAAGPRRRRAARADLPALRGPPTRREPGRRARARGRRREALASLRADAIVEAFADRQLMIADGHHRYETTVEYAQAGGSPWMMVVLVSTSDPGLTIFPTHRTAASFDASTVRYLRTERPARCARDASRGQACDSRVHARPGRGRGGRAWTARHAARRVARLGCRVHGVRRRGDRSGRRGSRRGGVPASPDEDETSSRLRSAARCCRRRRRTSIPSY